MWGEVTEEFGACRLPIHYAPPKACIKFEPEKQFRTPYKALKGSKFDSIKNDL